MSTPRIIPTLLHKNGRLVLSRNFQLHQDIGNPHEIADRLKKWDVDELMFLDITSHWCNIDQDIAVERLAQTIRILSENCFIPLSVGGGIKTINQMKQLLHAGADRLVLSSAACKNPKIITDAAELFGSQAINVCLDVKKIGEEYLCFIEGGKTRLEISPCDLAKLFENHGAGEITLQAMHNDGKACGFDLKLINSVSDGVDIPLIALGGAGTASDFFQALQFGAHSVAAANIFNFHELSYYRIKKSLTEEKIKLRPSKIGIDYRSARRNNSFRNNQDSELWSKLENSGLTGL